MVLPQKGRRGATRSEEGEKALAVSHIRRRVSVAAVKGHWTVSHTVGRLEVMGPGTAAAAGRRAEARDQEQR